MSTPVNKQVRFPRPSAPNEGHAELRDLKGSLEEIEFLLEQLSDLESFEEVKNATDEARRIKGDYNNAFDVTTIQLKQLTEQAKSQLQTIARIRSGRDDTTAIKEIRQQVLKIKLALRAAYRQRGALACMLDWQSPWFASTIDAGSNRLNEGISAHVFDYKRDGHLDARAYERKFLEQYTQHLGSTKQQCYLTNSGMAAYMTVLQFLGPKVDPTDAIAILEPSYFENVLLVKRFLPQAVSISPKSDKHCLKFLQEHQPKIVFCDIASNRGDKSFNDIRLIFNWANSLDKEITIVVDATCAPCQLLPPNLMRRLKENVSVIFVESLAKHHQFGLDLVTGGVIVAHLEDDMHRELKKARANFGSNISDVSVASLPSPSKKNMSKRLERLSRNVELLATNLESTLKKRQSPIDKVTWLKNGTCADWFKGGSFCIHFDDCCSAPERYQQYLDSVFAMAQSRNHPLVYGSSFGFDISRLYIINIDNPLVKPSLRVSVGTETQEEIQVLAKIMIAAAKRLGRQWHSSSCAAHQYSNVVNF